MKKKRKSVFQKILSVFVVIVTAGLLIFLGKTYQSIKRVEKYQPEITAAVKKYQMEKYESLVKAIILTESKGKGVDLMQSSESTYGKASMIDQPKNSINQGVKYLAEMIKEAKKQGCDLSTAIQSYNFGKDYIVYVKKRGGINTLEIAEEYSKDVLSPLLGNEEKTTYRYWRIQSLLYNGGYLYHNGGNMFYSKVVSVNEDFIDLYEKIWK
ncbi:lysozyme family protein [Enterococcus ratti]|nr:lysozyme family protein [Enterococcus ratti]